MASALLLVAAVAAALYHHHQRSGGAAFALVALVVAGSGAFVQLLDPAARMSFLALAAIVVALVLAYETERRPGGQAGEVYPGDSSGRLLALRWASVGALLGAASWVHPAFLALFVPAAVAARLDRAMAPAWVAAGAVLPWLLALWRGALGEGWSELPSPAQLLNLELTGWNQLYLLGGRHVGLVVWFLPALLLIFCYRRGSGRGWLLAAVALATLALPFLAPHNFWGGPGNGGNRWFLPLYGALWLLPVRVPKARWLALAALGAGLFLWPAWRAPRATASGADSPSSHPRSGASRLPYETTQRELPAAAEWQGTGVWSRSLTAGLREGEQGPELVPADGPAELLIAAERPLQSVLLDFGPRAGSDLEVAGGRTGNTMFRPDGGVRFEVDLDDPLRRHSMWWSDKTHHLYLLELEMPAGPERTLPVAIMARPLDALPRSLDPESLSGGGEG